MMHKYRGIVCEKKPTYTVFLTEDGEFLRGTPLIATVEIGEEVEFHLIASASPTGRMKPIFLAPALIAALLLIFLVASWFPKTTTAYAYIQVEGDSTIEIGVDERGKVISLHSTTETIKEWEGQSIDLVLAKAVEQVSTDNKELSVTTVYEKEDKPKLKKQIEKVVQEVKKEKASPKKKPVETKPKNIKPKEEKAKPPGQIKKEEKSLNPIKEQKNPSTEKPVKSKETKNNSNDNKAQPTKENKPINNSNKIPGQEKKKNEVKSNNGNNSNKNSGNGNNKNSNN